MGLTQNTIDVVLFLRRQGLFPDNAAVAEIGAQQLSNVFFRHREGLAALAHAFGARNPFPGQPVEIAPPTGVGPEPMAADAPSARPFWEWLGCTYTAIDIDDSPGSLPLDLKYDNVPDWARARFHVVTNCGTTEHVANQLNAFKIIHDLTAPGGVMLHDLPCQGMLNHGLVNYNPKWFWLLARSNGYEVLHMDYSSTHERPPLPKNIVDYISMFTPGFGARAERYGAADAGLVAALCKRHDIEFVPPLDVPDAVTTDHPALAERYWTVLQPDGQARLGDHLYRTPLVERMRHLFRGARRRLRLLRRRITF
jgi:hypothetical protein